MSSGQIVLITGATSFIGSHVINLLLQEGWNVRGTVRSLTSDKTKAVREMFQEYAKQLELVEADLKRTEGWDVACKGCTYVLHLACPVEVTTFAKDAMNRYLKDPPEVKKAIDTVISGTQAVLEAAKKNGVKRVVMTSSIAAHIPSGWCESSMPIPNVPGTYDPEAHLQTISEATWTNEKIVDGYLLAKVVSERVAWEAMEGSSTEFVTISPCYTFGPQLHQLIVCDSTTMIDIAMCQPPNSDKALPAMPSMTLPLTDVRDVAKAHVKAMLLPAAAGNRYVVATANMDSQEILEICTELFKPMGYSTLRMNLPKCVVGLMGCCDVLMWRIHRNWGKYPKIDNTKVKRDLVPELIDLRTSIVDTVLASVITGRYQRKPGFKTDKPEYQAKETVSRIVLKASLS